MFVALLVLTLQGGWIAEIVTPRYTNKLSSVQRGGGEGRDLAVKRSRSYQLGALCSCHLAQLVMEVSNWTVYEYECITFQVFF